MRNIFGRIKKTIHQITAEQVAWFLTILGILTLFIGLLPEPLPRIIKDLYANLATSFISIGVTVLLIDRIRERRAKEREKEMLISQMSSPFSLLACDAARIIRDRGWHKELAGIMLWKANLEGAELWEFNLAGVNLVYANLNHANLNGAILDGADLTDANLSGAMLHNTSLKGASIITTHSNLFIFEGALFQNADLTGAKFLGIFNDKMTDSEHIHLQAAGSLTNTIMPNGKKYNGCYNLTRDLQLARAQNILDDPNKMAEFYGVSAEEYNAGQEWYKNFDQKANWWFA